MNTVKFIQIPFIKKGKIISNNLYNIYYVTNISFLYEENKIIIEFANEANNSTIHLNIKVMDKKDRENFKKLELALHENLRSSNFISILELLRIHKLELIESDF